MRGFKPIDFNQFHIICNKWKYDFEAIKVCHDWTNPKEGCLCTASMCHLWRKLGSADIKVVKTSHNSKSMPLLPRKKCKYIGELAYRCSRGDKAGYCDRCQ